jgi:serine/threonine protein kinase
MSGVQERRPRFVGTQLLELDTYAGSKPTTPITTPIITIPDKLLETKQGVTNYDKVTDGEFGEIFLQKFKRQFVLKSHNPIGAQEIPLGVKLTYFKNIDKNTFTKLFVYNKAPDLEPVTVLTKILSEVYYHKKFSELQEICGFSVPELLEYGFITDDEQPPLINKTSDEFAFYITTKYVNDTDVVQVSSLPEFLDKADVVPRCEIISEKVKEIDECLQRNGLYHNDLSTDNVMVNLDTNEITIIDFSEATEHLVQFAKYDKFCTSHDSFKSSMNGGRVSKKRGRVSKKRGRVSKKRGRVSKKRGHISRRGRVSRRGRISRKRNISRKRKI